MKLEKIRVSIAKNLCELSVHSIIEILLVLPIAYVIARN